jgi:hypothetical protein
MSKTIVEVHFPIAIALTNYHIKEDPLRREPVHESRVGFEGERESRNVNRARL